MSHLILVHGKPLDPAKAAGVFLPLDLFHVCPECASRKVLAKEPRRIDNLGGQQAPIWIPRMQDRWCQDCGHRWSAVLAPEMLAK